MSERSRRPPAPRTIQEAGAGGGVPKTHCDNPKCKAVDTRLAGLRMMPDGRTLCRTCSNAEEARGTASAAVGPLSPARDPVYRLPKGTVQSPPEWSRGYWHDSGDEVGNFPDQWPPTPRGVEAAAAPAPVPLTAAAAAAAGGGGGARGKRQGGPTKRKGKKLKKPKAGGAGAGGADELPDCDCGSEDCEVCFPPLGGFDFKFDRGGGGGSPRGGGGASSSGAATLRPGHRAWTYR